MTDIFRQIWKAGVERRWMDSRDLGDWQEYRCPVCDHEGSPCPQHDPGQDTP